jgi:hypothetical protein
MEVGGNAHHCHFTPRKDHRYPLYRRFSGPRSLSGRVRRGENLPHRVSNTEPSSLLRLRRTLLYSDILLNVHWRSSALGLFRLTSGTAAIAAIWLSVSRGPRVLIRRIAMTIRFCTRHIQEDYGNGILRLLRVSSIKRVVWCTLNSCGENLKKKKTAVWMLGFGLSSLRGLLLSA